jgi:hypothetical protein
MKKTIIGIALLIVAIGANAQAIKKINSKFTPGDFIWQPPGAREVTPIAVNTGTDTIRTIGYLVNFPRDTTGGFSVLVTGYDRNAAPIYQYTINSQCNVYNKWTVLVTSLDALIHSKQLRVTFQIQQ